MSTTDPSFTPRSRDELLDLVYRRGRELRVRRAGVRVMSGAVALMLVLGTQAAVTSDDDTSLVRAADDGRPENASDPAEPGEPEAGEPSETSTTTGVTVTTVEVCRNSHNPACGPFRWDPEPVPNTPAQGRVVSIEPARPVAGQEVTIRVELRDEERVPTDGCGTELSFGDDTPVPHCVAGYACPPERPYGPWDPPEPKPGTSVASHPHVYEEPGTYQFVARYTTGFNCNTHWPWDDEVTVRGTITVEAPPSMTSTTSTTTTTTTSPLPL